MTGDCGSGLQLWQLGVLQKSKVTVWAAVVHLLVACMAPESCQHAGMDITLSGTSGGLSVAHRLRYVLPSAMVSVLCDDASAEGKLLAICSPQRHQTIDYQLWNTHHLLQATTVAVVDANLVAKRLAPP